MYTITLDTATSRVTGFWFLPQSTNLTIRHILGFFLHYLSTKTHDRLEKVAYCNEIYIKWSRSLDIFLTVAFLTQDSQTTLISCPLESS